MRARALAVVASLGAACRAADPPADAAPDAADVYPLTQGVALAFFGEPSPLGGVPDPVFFVGCPKNGIAAVELFVLHPDGTVDDKGGHAAEVTRTGTHDHVAIGSDLVADLDEVGAPPTAAPFVYDATVTTAETFFVTNGHTFVAHVLNPAMPAQNSLGVWNTDTLVTCP